MKFRLWFFSACIPKYDFSEYMEGCNATRDPRIWDQSPWIWDHKSCDQNQQILVQSGFGLLHVFYQGIFGQKNWITDEKLYLVMTLSVLGPIPLTGWLSWLSTGLPRAGGRVFKPRPDQYSGSTNNWGESASFLTIYPIMVRPSSFFFG